MMRILPALGEVFSSGVLRRVTVVGSDISNSDMNGLPGRNQGEIQGEGGAFARAALHADVTRVLLDDAVGDRKTTTGAAGLPLHRCGLGSEKRVVDALNVFLRNDRACVGDANADTLAAQRC